MNAGRELDARVAEQVMHLKRAESWLHVEGWECHADEKGGGPYYKEPLPNYSTSISAAWEVVEKFQKYSNEPILISHSETQHLWRVQFRYNLSIQASDFPLAVCLAALKALGYIACGDECGQSVFTTKVNLMPDLKAIDTEVLKHAGRAFPVRSEER